MKIEERLSNSLNRFADLTFKEMLDLSKILNKYGYDFVNKIRPMPTNFREKCKHHRNFHAHLTENNHKGFNDIQSVYALYILSNYFRLLILELSGDKEFDQKLFENEYKDINLWIKDNVLTKIIKEIGEDQA